MEGSPIAPNPRVTRRDGGEIDEAEVEGLARLLAGSMPDAWDASAVRSELARSDARIWTLAHAGAVDDRHVEQAIGVLMARVVCDELHILVLAVAPAARRAGAGRRLVESAIGHARSLRAERILLELRVSNTAAQALYHACGFVVVGRRPRYYPGGEDALLMTLDLAGSRAEEGSGTRPAPTLPETPE